MTFTLQCIDLGEVVAKKPVKGGLHGGIGSGSVKVS